MALFLRREMDSRDLIPVIIL